jgi:O-antigen ligase
LRRVIFFALVCLIPLTAVPYGTFEAWWKAAFVCAVFGICILAIVEGWISGNSDVGPISILLPMLALAGFACLQSVPWGGASGAWHAVSADPYQTRFFVLQVLALTVFLALLYRYAGDETSIWILIHVVIAVAVASAIFGMLRQTAQQNAGFVLPLLKPAHGYGQFLNKNHFAYLMEMAFGLGIGVTLARGVRPDRVMLYVALLFPIWIALVLSNSRGGILAMLAQVLIATLWFVRPRAALRTAMLAGIVVAVLLGTLWVGGDRLATNIESAPTHFTGDTTRDGASRNEIWRATLKMFAAHPIAGAGLGGYWIGITAFHDASGSLTPQEAHNEYLELLSSGGVIGLAIGIWFGVMVIRRVRTNLQSDHDHIRALRYGAILGIAGVVVHSLVDFGLHMISNAVVFMVLLAIATASTNKKLIDPGLQQQ